MQQEKQQNDPVAIPCAVCGKQLIVPEHEIPKTADDFLSYCLKRDIPHIIDWDNNGNIITFCCGNHLKDHLKKVNRT